MAEGISALTPLLFMVFKAYNMQLGSEGIVFSVLSVDFPGYPCVNPSLEFPCILQKCTMESFHVEGLASWGLLKGLVFILLNSGRLSVPGWLRDFCAFARNLWKGTSSLFFKIVHGHRETHTNNK